MSSPAKRILVVVGTRPEAIKLAPVVLALRSSEPSAIVRVCVTAQHRHMLDQVLSLFRVTPDWDLNLMHPGQDLTDITNGVAVGLRHVLREWRPQIMVVQGDTTTALAAALAAYYEKIPVAHVEAGLRTNDRYNPWPEEMNRRLVSALATYHFAPTQTAYNNLLRENVPPTHVWVTGNTVVDSLLQVVTLTRFDKNIRKELDERFAFLNASRKLIVVTAHRRESFGAGLESIFQALQLLAKREDVQIVYPVHLNPNVQGPAQALLGSTANIHLLEPLGYLQFVGLLDRAHIVITDSGGIQEEAPSLGKPVLVTRQTTERPEAIEAGTVRLVGTSTVGIVSATEELLDNSHKYEAMARAHNPYGDGTAAIRIANHLVHFLD